MTKEEPILSPYVGTSSDEQKRLLAFFEEFYALLEKHGYNQYFIVVGQPVDQQQSHYTSRAGPKVNMGLARAVDALLMQMVLALEKNGAGPSSEETE